MKRVLLASVGVAALCMASYAATFMEVKTKDGNIVKFDVESVNEVIFEEKSTPADSNHPYVDLGLPSGTLWATYNVGATKPEEYGDYIAWGETEPKEVYNMSTYKYATMRGGDLDSLKKYNYGNTEYPCIIDSLFVLLPEDDAATSNWGKDWRMPTYLEMIELMKNTYAVQTNVYNGTDVRGVIFYKAKEESDKGQATWRGEVSSDYSASSDVHVFLPASGFRWDDSLYYVGNSGFYWSSSLGGLDHIARNLYFEEYKPDLEYLNRACGLPVRAVRAKK